MISILIVNWNTKELVRACLRSITESLHDISYEVIVVDNHSHDGSVEMIQKEFPDVQLIRNDHNAGFAEANNQAFASSKGEMVLILNPDTVINRSAIDHLSVFLQRASEEYVAASCRLLNIDLSTQYYMHRRFPRAIVLPCALLHKRFSWFKPSLVRNYLYLNDELEHDFDIEQPAAACIMVKRSYLEEYGLFDEKRFPIYYNDVDFCYRISKNGKKIRYISGASIIHAKGQSVSKLNLNENLSLYVRSSQLFFKKHKMIVDYVLLKIIYSVFVSLLLLINLILFMITIGMKGKPHILVTILKESIQS